MQSNNAKKNRLGHTSFLLNYIQEGVGEHAVGKGILVLTVIAKQILNIVIAHKLDLQ